MKKEFAIGETFQYGLAKLKCVKAPCKGRYDSCSQCIFYDDCQEVCSIPYFIGNCYKTQREDKTDVIFKKVED